MTNQSNTVHPHIEGVVLTPGYVTRFQCLGAECPDTCCSGWNVAVDFATHDAYMRCQAPEWVPKFKTYIKVHEAPTEQSAATILRAEDTGNCHFLGDGWCSIQSDLGEDLISNTCSSYPRLSVKLGDALFQSMSLSCPEAARLALTDPAAFDFQAPVLQIRQQELRQVTSPWALSLEQMQSIHTFALQVAKTSGLSLVERLVCLGLLCENLGSYFKANNFDGVDSVVAGIEELIVSGQVEPLVASLEGSHSTQAVFFRSLWLLGRNPQANVCFELGKQVTVDDLVQAAQQFYRKFRHNAVFANALHESLVKAGWSKLDKAGQSHSHFKSLKRAERLPTRLKPQQWQGLIVVNINFYASVSASDRAGLV